MESKNRFKRSGRNQLVMNIKIETSNLGLQIVFVVSEMTSSLFFFSFGI